MKTFFMVLVLAVSGFVAGCQQESSFLAATGTQGLLDSTAQRNRRYDNITNVNTRMLVDDWDMFWLYERSSTLTPHIVHVGNR